MLEKLVVRVITGGSRKVVVAIWGSKGLQCHSEAWLHRGLVSFSKLRAKS